MNSRRCAPLDANDVVRVRQHAGSEFTPFSPYIYTTLHKALKQAVMDGFIPRNVTEASR